MPASSTGAAGSGSRGQPDIVEEVNRLLKQFSQMRRMLKTLGGLSGGGGRRRGPGWIVDVALIVSGVAGRRVMLAIRMRRIDRRNGPRSAWSSAIPARPGIAASSRWSATTIPRTKPASVTLDKERIAYWVGRGAQLSDTVRTLLSRHATAEAPAGAASEGAPPAGGPPAS